MEIDDPPHGSDFMLGNLSIYETLDKTPRRLLIAVYDIFGDTANTRLFADFIAETYGFRVIVPDFYRGEPWDNTNRLRCKYTCMDKMWRQSPRLALFFDTSGLSQGVVNKSIDKLELSKQLKKVVL